MHTVTITADASHKNIKIVTDTPFTKVNQNTYHDPKANKIVKAQREGVGAHTPGNKGVSVGIDY
jgi:hypothetical protein